MMKCGFLPQGIDLIAMKEASPMIDDAAYGNPNRSEGVYKEMPDYALPPLRMGRDPLLRHHGDQYAGITDFL